MAQKQEENVGVTPGRGPRSSQCRWMGTTESVHTKGTLFLIPSGTCFPPAGMTWKNYSSRRNSQRSGAAPEEEGRSTEQSGKREIRHHQIRAFVQPQIRTEQLLHARPVPDTDPRNPGLQAIPSNAAFSLMDSTTLYLPSIVSVLQVQIPERSDCLVFRVQLHYRPCALSNQGPLWDTKQLTVVPSSRVVSIQTEVGWGGLHVNITTYSHK